jgi:putative oxidoreductase
MKRKVFIDAVSYAFVLLFVYTGINKLIDNHIFQIALGKSDLFASFAAPLSFIVPTIELVLAVLLLVRRTRIKGLFGSFILMALFTIYVGIMVYFRTARPCTCGGIMGLLNWHQHFYFNSIFTLLAIAAYRLDRQDHLSSNSPSKSPTYA